MRHLWFVVFTLLTVAVAPAQAKAPAKAKPLPPVVKRAFNAIMAGDPKPLKNDFTPEMAKALTPELMQATKKQFVTPLGALVSVKVTSNQKAQGMTVTVFVMHLKKGDLTGQMAQDAGGKVAGLYVRPGNK
jgi:hypothetical protein